VSELEHAVLDEVRRVAAAELEVRFAVEPEHHLVRDLRLDSVSALTLAVGLEDRFHVRLSDADTARVETVGDLVRLVADRARDGDAAAARAGEERA
jgi:acyl carrier protein